MPYSVTLSIRLSVCLSVACPPLENGKPCTTFKLRGEEGYLRQE